MSPALVTRIAEGRDLGGVALSAIVTLLGGSAIYGLAFGIWRDPLMSLFSAIKLPLLFVATVLASIVLSLVLAAILKAPLAFKQSAVCVLVGLATTAVAHAADPERVCHRAADLFVEAALERLFAEEGHRELRSPEEGAEQPRELGPDEELDREPGDQNACSDVASAGELPKEREEAEVAEHTADRDGGDVEEQQVLRVRVRRDDRWIGLG